MKKVIPLFLAFLLIASQAFAGGIFGGGSGGGAPSGAAGGDLTGTYPDPTVKTSVSLTTPVIGAATGTSLRLSGTAAGALAVGTITTPATIFQVAETITTSPRGIMSSQHSTSTDGARLHLRKSRGTNASPTTIVTGDTLGKVVATGYEGTSYVEMGELAFESLGTVATGRVAEQLSLSLGTDAATSVLSRALQINTGTGGATKTSFYNLYTSASVFESLDIDWQTSTNVAVIRTATTGGTARRLVLRYGNSAVDAVSVGTSSIGTASTLGVTFFSTSGANAVTASTAGRVQFGNGASTSATTGTHITANVMEGFAPTATNDTVWESLVVSPTWAQSANNSTGAMYAAFINPTINLSTGGTKSSAWDALRIAVVETANPTGTKNLIHALAGSAGTTEIFSVSNAGAIATASTFTSSATADIGWAVVTGSNTACNTTCTSACVFGFDTALGTTDVVACTSALADVCLCAGAS